MRLGLVHPAGSERQDPQYILGRLDEWIVTAGKPAAFGVRAVNLNPHLIRELQARDIIPVVALTSTRSPERAIDIISESRPPIVVRWDHEVNNRAWTAAPWTGMDPDIYRRNWRNIRELLPHWVKMAYIPMLLERHAIDDFGIWYPGDEHVDIVGFDTYAWGERLIKPSTRWSHPIAWWQRHSDRPIWVTEFGITHYRTRQRERLAWLRDLRNVEGVDVAMYFDIDKPDEGKHARWQLDMRERRLLGRMMR